MVRAFVLLLLLFFGAYIGLEILRATQQDMLVMGTYNLQSLQSTEFRAFLGIAIIICEFIIILFSMLFHIADTLRDVIKPMARLVPLGLFVLAIYRTFAPILSSFLPTEITVAAETDPIAYLTAAAADGTLTRTILFSLGSMLLFVLANRALGAESSELRALKAEVAKLRRVTRG
jgi:hypothetical protein